MAAAAGRLRLDALALQVISALAEQGIDAILLKGPAIARWLYDVAEERRYVDVDLLVDPNRNVAASRVLEDLCFDPPTAELPRNKPRNASEFTRADGAIVDLHKAILGVGMDPARAWPIFLQHSEPLALRGGSVRSLDEVARTVHLALQAAQNGTAGGRSLYDLSLALEKVPFSVWNSASRLAEQLDATPSFASGLRLLPEGSGMALRLGIAGSRSVEAELTSASLPESELSFAMGFEWLAGREGLAAKLRYVITKLFPPPPWIRQWSPWADRGFLPLVAAYLWRWIWLARHLPAGYMAWRRAKRTTNSTSP